jgi:ribosomal-protein-alanine N-acetyltransferase
MTPFTLRHMSAADLEPVVRLDRMSFPLPWPASAFAKELENPQARCWVVEKELESPLDFSVPDLAPFPPLTYSAGALVPVAVLIYWLVLDEAHIATLAVHPSLRRRGLARLILWRALDEAASEGAKTAFLEVRESNQAALELYHLFGFEVTGRRPRYYVTEDAVLMTLRPLDAGLLERPKAQTEEQ